MTPNKALLWSAFQAVFLLFSLIGPYIGVGVYQLFACLVLCYAYFKTSGNCEVSQRTHAMQFLKDLVKLLNYIIIGIIVPISIFLYFGAEVWVKSLAVVSIIFYEMGHIKWMKLIE